MLRKILEALLALIANLIGIDVVRKIVIVRPANATGYTANDVINDVNGFMFVIPNAVRKAGGACTLNAIVVKTDQGGGAQTWRPKVFLHQFPRLTILADNAAFTLSFAIQMQTGYLGSVLLPALAAVAGGTIDETTINNLNVVLQTAPGSTSLYFDLQTLDAFTPSSGALYEVEFLLTQS